MKVLILGGNRFFGKKLAHLLMTENHQVTLLNRGNLDDGLGRQVSRIACDRTNEISFKAMLEGKTWDIVYDQICFDYRTAKFACEVFQGKTQRYIFTSSQSVYGLGKNLKEEDFQAQSHLFHQEETRESDYAEAKRQAEAAFYKYAKFSFTCLRFPIVIGSDDYTQRFKFHVERIKKGLPIYFPNEEANISFVHSDFAANVLAKMVNIPVEGALNVASPEPICLKEFIKIIESEMKRKRVKTDSKVKEFFSPYGIEKDWFMNCERLSRLGLVDRQIKEWLPDLLNLDHK